MILISIVSYFWWTNVDPSTIPTFWVIDCKTSPRSNGWLWPNDWFRSIHFKQSHVVWPCQNLPIGKILQQNKCWFAILLNNKKFLVYNLCVIIFLHTWDNDTLKNVHSCSKLFFFPLSFFQFCDVAKVVIVNKLIWPNLAINKTWKKQHSYTFFATNLNHVKKSGHF